MNVTQLTVNNYRNLSRQTICPDSGLNVFSGHNAQGKTNLVESVYLCAIGKSPRTEKDKDLIRWEQQQAYVKIKYNCRFGEGEIAVTINSHGKKQITVNSVPITKMGELMGYFNCIYFSPNEIKIISSSPNERRRFLDVDLCQTDKNYFYSLSRFNKVLAQRNNLLKTARSLQEATDTAFIWDEQLAEEGAKIIYKRRAFCNKLKDYAKRCHAKLTDNNELLSLEYSSQVDGDTANDIAKNYLALLQKNTEKDFQLKYTSVGCQRDDIVLKISDVDVRTFGSQGQLRTTALSLKLAELMIFKDIIGEYPVLLLDDVLSELDLERQSRLLNFDKSLQILLTTATDVPDKLAHYKLFNIDNGTCTEIKN